MAPSAKPKRDAPGRISRPPAGRTLVQIAAEASYRGSDAHKNQPGPSGRMAPRQNASKCPPELSDDLSKPNELLRIAITQGNIGAPWENGYPRYVWYVGEDGSFLARLTNRGLGEYKGWPIGENELPKELKNE